LEQARVNGRAVVWVMVPSGAPTEQTVQELTRAGRSGDIVVDGGNSNFHDSQRRAADLAAKGLAFLDCGTSGGVWGLRNGYCLMIGGEKAAFDAVEPVFKSLAPQDGYLYAGPSGAGHYSKMVHNGIEYGLLQAYGEGFEILETSGFNFDLPALAKLWNHGSVVRSWLLELLERGLDADPNLESIRGYVEDSGEGRWTVQAAIDQNVPAPVITHSLLARLASRQQESFSAKVIAALRNQFGGHAVHTDEGRVEAEHPAQAVPGATVAPEPAGEQVAHPVDPQVAQGRDETGPETNQ
ncbi:MAG TPA: decarboxylating 6-phosphogluconate dehydrogenase, partial [Deinococcales bacterium]|nr:decarboxylating 6-phosphogluconate dehydrogenase [Deinococcales bacterium]